MDKNEQYTKQLKEQMKAITGENRYLEFKSNHQDPDKLGKYISALSNGACLDNQDFGYLYFGVEDKTLEIIGTSFDISREKAQGNQSLEIYLRQHVSPNIDFRIEKFLYEGKVPVVMFRIPAAVNEPTYFLRKPYVRVDSHVTDLTPYADWMRTIYLSRSDWSAGIIQDATINDLDKDAIKLVREGYCLRFPDYADEMTKWSEQVFLDKAGLTIDGEITRATMLLIGRPESAPKLGHIAQIVWKCKEEGNTVGDVYTIPFVLSTSKLLQRIRNYQFKIYPDNSLIPTEVWKYDTRSILEALHNCIAHQDYTLNERIIVTEDSERLTFESSGCFFDGSYEDYVLGEKTPKRYRNPFLMKAMVNVKMIDSQGYGIHNMFERQRSRFLPMPDYKLTDNSVVMHLPGTVIDKNYSLLLMENSDINLTESILLDKVQKRQEIPYTACQALRKKHLIEGRYPNIYISKTVAGITDKKAEYSKHKGVNTDACEAVILSALNDHGVLSREEIDELVKDMVSDLLVETQKKRRVLYILEKMIKKGLIINITKGNISKYLLADRT